jgi:hypothetical protein
LKVENLENKKSLDRREFGPIHGLKEAGRVINRFQAFLLASDLPSPSKSATVNHLSTFGSSLNLITRSLQRLEAEMQRTLDRPVTLSIMTNETHLIP